VFIALNQKNGDVYMTEISTIIKEVKCELIKIYGERLKKIILFGSFARGNFHKDSDLDLLVVIESPGPGIFMQGLEIDRMNDAIYDLILKFDIPISVIPVSEKQFLTSQNPLYEIVKKEGIAA